MIFNLIKTAPKLYITITAKTQHSQNLVSHKNSSVGKVWIMSQISSLKFPIMHDIKDNLCCLLIPCINTNSIFPVRFLIQSKLYITIIAKTQHSQNLVSHKNSSVGKAWIMSRISSLKFPIIHDIKDNLFGY